jgi:hypothetical protein
MRGEVLVGGMGRWHPGARRAKDLRLAAKAFERAGKQSPTPAVNEWMGQARSACLSMAADHADDELVEGVAERFEFERMHAGLRKTGTGVGPLLSVPGHLPAPGEKPGAYRMQVQCLEVDELQRKIASGELDLS